MSSSLKRPRPRFVVGISEEEEESTLNTQVICTEKILVVVVAVAALTAADFSPLRRPDRNCSGGKIQPVAWMKKKGRFGGPRAPPAGLPPAMQGAHVNIFPRHVNDPQPRISQ